MLQSRQCLVLFRPVQLHSPDCRGKDRLYYRLLSCVTNTLRLVLFCMPISNNKTDILMKLNQNKIPYFADVNVSMWTLKNQT